MCIAGFYLDPPVEARFTETKSRKLKKGVNLVDPLGYTYSIVHANSSSKNQTWRCSRKDQLKCKATVNTQDGWIVSKRHEHNHHV